MAPEVRLLPTFLARCHSACGWISLRIGLRQQARHHYEQVLRLCGKDFSAHVQLGRIAYRAGDYAGWRREFARARAVDPTRYARLEHAEAPPGPRLAGTGFDVVEERPAWRTLRSPDGSHSSEAAHAPEPAGTTADPFTCRERAETAMPDAAGPSDDCSSEGERLRLRDLGPIRRGEWRSCDLDELARRLGG